MIGYFGESGNKMPWLLEKEIDWKDWNMTNKDRYFPTLRNDKWWERNK